MPHPHILEKSLVQITDTARSVLERLYNRPSISAEEMESKFAHARDVMDLWSELSFDMGASEHISVAAQVELDRLVKESDAVERIRLGLTER